MCVKTLSRISVNEMMQHFGYYFLISITITANYIPVHGRDCEMDCTDLQVQQIYRSDADTGNSRVNTGMNAKYDQQLILFSIIFVYFLVYTERDVQSVIQDYRNCVRVCKERKEGNVQ